jgi:nitrogen regulatory protein PII
MKKIEAVILPSCVNGVRTQLRRRGICGELTLTGVQQGDTHKQSAGHDNGAANGLKERVKLELIVADRQADNVVGIILRHALAESQEPGGHVTLLDVSEVLQITHPESDISQTVKS